MATQLEKRWTALSEEERAPFAPKEDKVLAEVQPQGETPSAADEPEAA